MPWQERCTQTATYRKALQLHELAEPRQVDDGLLHLLEYPRRHRRHNIADRSRWMHRATVAHAGRRSAPITTVPPRGPYLRQQGANLLRFDHLEQRVARRRLVQNVLLHLHDAAHREHRWLPREVAVNQPTAQRGVCRVAQVVARHHCREPAAFTGTAVSPLRCKCIPSMRRTALE